MRSRFCVLMFLLLVASGCSTASDSEPEPGETAGGEAAAVKVFFHSGSGEDCGEVLSFDRTVPEATLAAAMEHLVAGPRESEVEEGRGGWFSEETEGMLISAEIDGRVARVDFEDLRDVIPNASTSCGSETLLAQLDATAKQFEVTTTVYSINGSPESFYEWLQRDVPEVETAQDSQT